MIETIDIIHIFANMEIITSGHTVYDILERNHHLLPVINRFGIKFGYGNDTVLSICEELNIDVNFFLLIINTYIESSYFSKKQIQEVSPKLVIDYLYNTHLEYQRHTLPSLEKKMRSFADSIQCSQTSKQLYVLFKAFKKELIIHFNQEEEHVFKYALSLISDEHQSQNNILNESKYLDEHTEIDEKISDLKILIIKYLKADCNQISGNTFINALYEFEHDIREHERIENLILIPQIIYLERNCLNYTAPTINRNLQNDNSLSNREIEVLQLLAKGYSIKEIANELNISVHTATSHRKNISEKVGIKSVSGLTTFALITGYMDSRTIDIQDLV